MFNNEWLLDTTLIKRKEKDRSGEFSYPEILAMTFVAYSSATSKIEKIASHKKLHD